MEFAPGAIFVFFVCAFCTTAINKAEWAERRKIDQRLKKLESGLCCGRGVFGCTGGENCDWDHK